MDDFVFENVIMLLFDEVLVAEMSDEGFVVVVGTDRENDNFFGDFEADCDDD